MKLYVLKTSLHNNFYVVAENPCEAEDRLIGLLIRAGYRSTKDQKVISITLFADELKKYSWSGGEPIFPEYDAVLILPTSCEDEKNK